MRIRAAAQRWQPCEIKAVFDLNQSAEGWPGAEGGGGICWVRV